MKCLGIIETYRTQRVHIERFWDKTSSEYEVRSSVYSQISSIK